MKTIPMLDLSLEYTYMKDEIDSAISNCLGHQKWIMGPEVKELEKQISHYVGVKHCIGVSSGTDALVLALRALAIKTCDSEYFEPGDEIITTPFTFTATGDAIIRAGALPVFIDVDPATCNIDIPKVREYLLSQDTNRVKGIVPVHLYGSPCDMDEINKLAEEFNLFIVEDVAQAFGGSYKNKKLGSIGTAGTFSFFPSKNLGCFGDGGMIATNDSEIARIAGMLLRHGGKDKYNVDHIGYNARLDTLQAAVLLAKLKFIDEFNERRRRIANVYSKELAGIGEIQLPEESASHVYHQYTIRTSRRDELQKHLNERGVSTMIYYPFPLHKMKLFEQGRSKIANSLENAEKLCDSVLSLPVEPLQTEVDTLRVIEGVKSFFKPTQ